MPIEKPEAASAAESYSLTGIVEQNARVIVGKNNRWTENHADPAGAADLERQFEALLQKIAADPALNEDTRALAQAKTEAVAEGLAQVAEKPAALRRALLDAKSWFATTATWVGGAIGAILKSEAAQKTLGTVTEAGVTAAVKSFTGAP